MTTIVFAAELVDKKGPVKYVHPSAHAMQEKHHQFDFCLFTKNGWEFRVRNFYNRETTELSVEYKGNDVRPNIGYARWYFFVVTGRYIELQPKTIKYRVVNIKSLGSHNLPRL